MKIAVLLITVSACLAYPADEVRPPAENVAPENVQLVAVPNQPVSAGPGLVNDGPEGPIAQGSDAVGEPLPGQPPVNGPVPVPSPEGKPEDDLKTDNTFWYGRSYYPVYRKSYSYYPRSYSYYSYPTYRYWSPYYWW